MIRFLAVLVAGLYLLVPSTAWAADQWIEVKSANFAVISNASDRATRRLVWQLEQMRSAMTVLWPWAKPDLLKPLNVMVVKDENSMRALAPEYWERRGATHPACLWVTGPDQHYLVVRTDVEIEGQGNHNPYISAYFAYIGLILDQSLDRDLPFWFRRGFTGVLSNTIVREDKIMVGPPIPWHLEILRTRTRLKLADLLRVKRSSQELTQDTFIESYDAQTWALVHYLMFGDQGKRAPALDAFITMVSKGKDQAEAFSEAFGSIEAVEGSFLRYIQQQLFVYKQVNVDAGVERERFPVRKVSEVEATTARALFHAAMRRPVESRAAIAEARKLEPNVANAYVAEGLLFDGERKVDEARAAFLKAAELGTTNAYVYYRLAMMAWQPTPSPQTLDELEAFLSKAVNNNPRYASAYAWLGQIRASRGNEAGMGFIRRAIVLEPREPQHRLRAAQVLLMQGKAAEARADVQAALALAEDDDDRREAQALLERISKAMPAPPR
jgi:tetratricopeptide (TPR) repeat protein